DLEDGGVVERKSGEKHRPLLSALGVTLHAVTALPGRALLERARKRAHEPRVRRDTLAGSRGLDDRLQGLGEPERDPPGVLLPDAELRPARHLVADDDELRVASGETYLHPRGLDLTTELEGGLAEQVEEVQMKGRAERVSHPPR